MIATIAISLLYLFAAAVVFDAVYHIEGDNQ